jgi:hypothetical protein
MKLQSNEKIVKVYHHDLFCFIVRGIKIWIASLPFFMVALMFSSVMPQLLTFSLVAAVFVLFALVYAYDFMMYYLDTLVLTNQRIVHLDWISPFRYQETQAMLDDIQNIESKENGFLSSIKLFDFGEFLVETASTKTVITFNEAPDPEGIKFFVTNLSRKHLGLDSNLNKDEIAQIVDQKLEKPNSKVARVD